MAELNLGLRFLLELAGIAALAFWGWNVTTAQPARIVLAVGAPIVLIVVWALAVAPKAENSLPQTTRMLIGSVLLLVAAGGVYLAGQPVAAFVFGALVVANTILMLVLGDPGTTLG
jgi:hypothetical protein